MDLQKVREENAPGHVDGPLALAMQSEIAAGRPDFALLLAAWAGDARQISAALDLEARPSVRDDRGNPAIYFAALSGSVEAVRTLVARDQHGDIRAKDVESKIWSNDGMTILMSCVRCAKLDVLKFFTSEFGCKLRLLGDVSGGTFRSATTSADEGKMIAFGNRGLGAKLHEWLELCPEPNPAGAEVPVRSKPVRGYEAMEVPGLPPEPEGEAARRMILDTRATRAWLRQEVKKWTPKRQYDGYDPSSRLDCRRASVVRGRGLLPEEGRLEKAEIEGLLLPPPGTALPAAAVQRLQATGDGVALPRTAVATATLPASPRDTALSPRRSPRSGDVGGDVPRRSPRDCGGDSPSRGGRGGGDSSSRGGGGGGDGKAASSKALVGAGRRRQAVAVEAPEGAPWICDGCKGLNHCQGAERRILADCSGCGRKVWLRSWDEFAADRTEDGEWWLNDGADAMDEQHVLRMEQMLKGCELQAMGAQRVRELMRVSELLDLKQGVPVCEEGKPVQKLVLLFQGSFKLKRGDAEWVLSTSGDAKVLDAIAFLGTNACKAGTRLHTVSAIVNSKHGHVVVFPEDKVVHSCGMAGLHELARLIKATEVVQNLPLWDCMLTPAIVKVLVATAQYGVLSPGDRQHREGDSSTSTMSVLYGGAVRIKQGKREVTKKLENRKFHVCGAASVIFDKTEFATSTLTAFESEVDVWTFGEECSQMLEMRCDTTLQNLTRKAVLIKHLRRMAPLDRLEVSDDRLAVLATRVQPEHYAAKVDLAGASPGLVWLLLDGCVQVGGGSFDATADRDEVHLFGEVWRPSNQPAKKLPSSAVVVSSDGAYVAGVVMEDLENAFGLWDYFLMDMKCEKKTQEYLEMHRREGDLDDSASEAEPRQLAAKSWRASVKGVAANVRRRPSLADASQTARRRVSSVSGRASAMVMKVLSQSKGGTGRRRLKALGARPDDGATEANGPKRRGSVLDVFRHVSTRVR